MFLNNPFTKSLPDTTQFKKWPDTQLNTLYHYCLIIVTILPYSITSVFTKLPSNGFRPGTETLRINNNNNIDRSFTVVVYFCTSRRKLYRCLINTRKTRERWPDTEEDNLGQREWYGRTAGRPAEVNQPADQVRSRIYCGPH